MDTIDILTTRPSVGNQIVTREEEAIAYWWSEDGDAVLRLHDPRTDTVETVSIDGFDPNGWVPFYWTGDEFIVSTRPETYLLERDGSTKEILPEDEYTLVVDVSSDGRYVLYIHYETRTGAGEWPLRLYDRTRDTARTLSEHPQQFGHAGFSPDDEWIGYRENASDTFGQGHHVVATLDGETERTFSIADSESRSLQHSWHPHGDHLVVRDRSTGLYRVGLYDWQTDEATWFGTGEYNERPRAVTSNGNRIVATRERDGAVLAVVYSTRDPESARELDLPEGVVSSIAEHRPDTIAVRFETSTTPPQVLLYDLGTDESDLLVDTRPDAFDALEMTEAEHVSYESTDGLTVNAILYRASQTPSPAVVNVHGGPTTAKRRKFNPFAQSLVNEGYTVLEPNYRGSTDQDRTFEEALRGDSGDGDVVDVAEAARWLTERDWIDSDRLAVFGHSYGAFNAAMQTIRYPDRWDVAIIENGGLDRVEILSDPNPYSLRHIIDDPDVETTEEYLRERSPVHRTDDVGCPVCVIQGENDPGIEMAERFVEGLESRGWTDGEQFRFEVFEDEGHVIEDRVELLELTTEVLGGHLR